MTGRSLRNKRLSPERRRQIQTRLIGIDRVPDLMEAIAYLSLPRRKRVIAKLRTSKMSSSLPDISDAEMGETRREIWTAVFRAVVPHKRRDPSFSEIYCYMKAKRPEVTEHEVLIAANQARTDGLIEPIKLDAWNWNVVRFGIEPNSAQPRQRSIDWHHSRLRFRITGKGLKTAMKLAGALVGASKGRTPPKKLRQPSGNAIKCYRCWYHLGFPNQQVVADQMSKELRRPVSQGAVSRWISSVKNYKHKGGILPDLDMGGRQRVRGVDPAILDMGPRTNSVTQRQRLRRAKDD